MAGPLLATIKRLSRRFPYLLVFLLVGAAYLLGWLDLVDNRLIDQRFRLTPRMASGGLVMVAIDPPSLQALGTWPWPRRYHAQIVERLFAAGAKVVALDLDFSSTSDEANDAALADAIAGAKGPVFLPAFMQYVPISESQVRLVGTIPLPRFRAHASLVSINIAPGHDGLVRTQPVYQIWHDRQMLSMPAALAGATSLDRPSFLIDFGINPDTIPVLSYSDVLDGHVGARQLAGKVVIVGATAVELGDRMAVPVHTVMPSPLVTALSYESLVQHRAIHEISAFVVLAVAFLLAMLLGPKFTQWSWRRGLAACAVAAVAFWGLPLVMQVTWPVTMDTAPWFLVVGLSYGIGLATTIDRQTLATLFFRREADHHRAVIRNLADNTFDGILIIYVDGTIDFFNPAAERMFGYSRNEIIGRDIADLVDPAAIHGDNESVADLPPLPRQGMREGLAWRKDGTSFPIELVVAHIDAPESDPADDSDLSYLLTVRDISERKQAEEEAARHRDQMLRVNRMQTMGNLASGLAHELGQPLTAIHFLLYRAGQKFEGDPVASETLSEDVNQAMAQAEKAGEIVKELRRFVGKGETQREAADIGQLVDEVLGSLNYYPPAADVDISAEIDDDLPAVEIDRLLIQQVLSNLIRNAIDAMAEVGRSAPRLAVRCTATAEGGVRVEVEDNGIGIPPDVVEHIFQPFYTTKSEGLGYGLALCKTIIEQHDGTLAVDSEPGRTVFAFTLPAAATDAQPSLETADRAV